MIIERFFGKGRHARGVPAGNGPAARRPGPDASAAPQGGDGPQEGRSREAGTARSTAGPATSTAVAPGPSYEEVAARAYELWLSQGCPEGRQAEHWSEAERQLRSGRTPD